MLVKWSVRPRVSTFYLYPHFVTLPLSSLGRHHALVLIAYQIQRGDENCEEKTFWLRHCDT